MNDTIASNMSHMNTVNMYLSAHIHKSIMISFFFSLPLHAMDRRRSKTDNALISRHLLETYVHRGISFVLLLFISIDEEEEENLLNDDIIEMIKSKGFI